MSNTSGASEVLFGAVGLRLFEEHELFLEAVVGIGVPETVAFFGVSVVDVDMEVTVDVFVMVVLGVMLVVLVVLVVMILVRREVGFTSATLARSFEGSEPRVFSTAMGF